MKRYRDTQLHFTEDGRVFGPRGERRVRIDRYGYARLNCHPNKTVHVHKAMAELYIGERPDGMTVNHRDGNKLNNAASNLEYLSAAENVRHAFKSGLVPKCRPALGYHSLRAAERATGIPRKQLAKDYP